VDAGPNPAVPSRSKPSVYYHAMPMAAVVLTATVPLWNLGLGSSAVRRISWTLDESAILRMGVHLGSLGTTPKGFKEKG
jgi:hypothetical protein